MYPTRRVNVTFIIEDDEESEIDRIDRHSAYGVADQVSKAASREDAALIRTESDDEIYWEQEVLIEAIEDVEKWALHQQDANAGVECAECGSEIGFEEGCSSPRGSMHKGCASKNEAKNPEMW